MIQAKVGQYFYGRHRRSFGVWVYDWVSEDGSASSIELVGDFQKREEASEYVWKINSWENPNTALKN